MIYEALISQQLPTNLGEPVRGSFVASLRALWLHGSPRVGARTCRLSAARVLAGCAQALRAAGFRELEVLSDAGELLGDVRLHDDGLMDLPPSWSEEACAFRVRAKGSRQHLALTASLRFTPRLQHPGGPLVGSVRALWRPEAHAPDSVRRTLRSEGLRAVHDAVTSHGDDATSTLAEALTAALDTPVSWRAETRVPWMTDGLRDFGARLQGFDPRALEVLELTAAYANADSHGLPALASDGTQGRLRQGRFIPLAEVRDVV